MSAFESAIAHIQSIQSNVEQYAVECINENKEYILNLLRDGQLGKGKSPEDLPLFWADKNTAGIGGDGTYSRDWKEGRNQPKKRGQPYNFEWSGETFDKMDLTIKGTEFEIFSRAWYFKTLLDEYGEVFYLSDFHIKILNEEVILDYIHKRMMEELVNF